MSENAAPRRATTAFGELLRFWREGFEFTQESLALSIDVSPRHVSRLENAQVSPSPQMVEKIGDAFSLTGRDRELLLYASGPGVGFESVDVSAQPEPWLQRLFNSLVQTMNPSPAMVAHVSGALVSSNDQWRALFSPAQDLPDGASTTGFWEAVFESGELNQPKGWAQTRLGLLLSYKQLSIIRADPSLEALFNKILESCNFDTDWIQSAAKIQPRPSFPITTGIDNDLRHWEYSSFAIDESGVMSAHKKVWWLHVLLPREA